MELPKRIVDPSPTAENGAEPASRRLAARARPIRVFVADDHPLLRSGLNVLLGAQAGMEVVGGASDGPSALDAIVRLQPDVVVMDISMPEFGGAELTARIKKVHPEINVLAFTVHEDAAFLRDMLDAGALGYLLKSADAEELVRAIETVASGGIYLDKVMSRHAARTVQRSGAHTRGAQLSEREAEVLRAIARGHSAKEIAAELGVGTRTIETYKSRAMEKLALKDRADIVRYAVQSGWLRML